MKLYIFIYERNRCLKCFKNQNLTKEEIISKGGNSSMIHIDWMIGSNQIDIDLSGKTIIQLTTGSIEEVTALNDWVKKYNGDLLEGVISCFPSQIGTEEGLILVSGSDNSINNCKDIIHILSPKYKNLGKKFTKKEYYIFVSSYS